MTLANISEGELSRRTKVKQPIIHRLLSGENQNPKLATIKPIAAYFMISVSQLIGEHDIDTKWNGLTSKSHHGWSEISLIDWVDIMKDVNKRQILKMIIVDCHVSSNAFALPINNQNINEIFPENSIIIIEPQIEPIHGDYLLVNYSTNEIIIKQLLIISDKKYLAPLSRKFGTMAELQQDNVVLGTVIRTIYDHRVINR